MLLIMIRITRPGQMFFRPPQKDPEGRWVIEWEDGGKGAVVRPFDPSSHDAAAARASGDVHPTKLEALDAALDIATRGLLDARAEVKRLKAQRRRLLKKRNPDDAA